METQIDKLKQGKKSKEKKTQPEQEELKGTFAAVLIVGGHHSRRLAGCIRAFPGTGVIEEEKEDTYAFAPL
ncbi:hypothetical protein [Brevibacillus gelatini]